eukprot:gene6210-6925_t
MEESDGDGEPSESQDESNAISRVKQRPLMISFGLVSKSKYSHVLKNCDIQSTTYNSKTGNYIIVDSRGITAWTKIFALDKTTRLMEFAAYQFNVIKILLYCRQYNVYFALSKDYQLKVYNLNFHETFSVESDSSSIIHMMFNADGNELITASTGEIQFWQFGEMSHHADVHQAKYGIILNRKFQAVNGKLISRIRLDEELQRLYCLCERDVWCYDMDGKLLFRIREASQVHLSACAYSSSIHMLIVGSLDGEINVLSTDGGKIHTFCSHVGLITEILVHPLDNNLVITASQDGYIKVFSLDILEELYSVKVFTKGIEHMALRSNDLLYVASTREIEIFDLNYFYRFWSQLRYSAQRIQLTMNAEKSLRVLALAEDGSVRLFTHTDGRKLCTVLPPPSVSATSKILDCVHDRDYNLVYLLVKVSEVWVYTTKTDPACHLAVINLWNDKAENKPKTSTWQPLQQLSKEGINCNCIEVLQDLMESEFVKGDMDGDARTGCNFLTCGMDSGEIILYNPLRNGRREKSIKLCKDPIMKMQYYKSMLMLMLLTKAKEGYFIQLFNRELHSIASVSCSEDLSVFSLKCMMLATGFSSGHVLTMQMSTEKHKSETLTKNEAPDHQSDVLSVSFHPTLDILCSSGKDSAVKIWSTDKALLCDISFEPSLTAACFLNSLGDILIGLKNQLFIIKHEGKLAWLADKKAESDKVRKPESEIYESPYLKYDIRRPISAESEDMNKYLVPYQDMIFSSIGSWVVTDDDAISNANSNDKNVDDLISDDLMSNAPSDLYQSSIHSDVTDISDQSFWCLPECIVSPDESTGSSGEDTIIEEDDVSEEVEDLEEQAPVDPMRKLQAMLVQSEKEFGNKKATKFSHSASEKLKNAKVDARLLRRKQAGKNVKKIPTKPEKNVSSGVKVESRTKAVRKTARKVNKSVEERRRAVQKFNNSSKQLEDTEGFDEIPADTAGITVDSEETTSPDAGYQSQVSIVVNEERPEITEEDQDAVSSGVLLSSRNAIVLKRISSGVASKDSSAESVDELADRSQSNSRQALVAMQDDTNLNKESLSVELIDGSLSPVVTSMEGQRVQTAASSDSRSSNMSIAREAESMTSKLVDDVDERDLQSPSSFSELSLGSYAASSVDFSSEEEDPDDEEFLDPDGNIRNRGDLSSNRSIASGRYEQEHYLKGIQQEDDVKIRVVPVFLPQLSVTIDANDRDPSRGDQNIPLTIYSLSSRASSRMSSRGSSKIPETRSPIPRAVSRQQQQGKPAPDETNNGTTSRQSNAPIPRMIRVPFGQIDNKDSLLSTSSINRESAGGNVVGGKVTSAKPKPEKKEDLVKYAMSSLKHKTRFPARDSPLLRSALKTRSPVNTKDPMITRSPVNTTIDGDNQETGNQAVLRHNSAKHKSQLGIFSPPQKSPSSMELEHRDHYYRSPSHQQHSRQPNLDYDERRKTLTNSPLSPALTEFRDSPSSARDLSFSAVEHLSERNLQTKNMQQPSRGDIDLRKRGEDADKIHDDGALIDYQRSKVYIESMLEGSELDSTSHKMSIADGGTTGSREKGTRKSPTGFDVSQNKNELIEVPLDIYKTTKSILSRTHQRENWHVNKVLEYNRPNSEDDFRSSVEKKRGDQKEVEGDMDGIPKEVLQVGKLKSEFGFGRNVSFNQEEKEQKFVAGSGENTAIKYEEKIAVSSSRKDSLPSQDPPALKIQRQKSKGTLIFINVPSDAGEKDDGAAGYHQNATHHEKKWIAPTQATKAALGQKDKLIRRSSNSCVASLHEVLLKRRAQTANSKDRQTSARFRREVIERQKIARCNSKRVSPSFSQEYMTEFLPETILPANNDKANAVSEYNTPVPLPDNKRKQYQEVNKKSLEARFSGQPFRLGKSVSNDENEQIILDFIKSSIVKDKNSVVLLPRPKSSPSIPAKCHDYVIVKDKGKHTKTLTKQERSLLARRFGEHYSEVPSQVSLK